MELRIDLETNGQVLLIWINRAFEVIFDQRKITKDILIINLL